MKELAKQYKHIKGWGIDANPDNEPTYPMKNYTGDDHKRLNYDRPPLQPVDVEVLHSIERPNLTAVVGTSVPPSGLSGMIRRWAFTFSEGQLTHWFALVFADRINVIEGIIDDLKHGYVPNIIKERGWKAEWEHNSKGVMKKVGVAAAILSAVIAIPLIMKHRKSLHV